MPRALALTLALVATSALPARADSPVPHRLTLPAGFRIGVWADHLPGVRFMALSPHHDVIVSRFRAGDVLLLADRGHVGHPTRTITLASGLDGPHGLAWHDGKLYVATTTRLYALTLRPDGLGVERRVRLAATLPPGGEHTTRTIGFGPDGKLYVSVGSSCNVCREADPRRAAILRGEPDGSHLAVYARGLRNAVGFTWQPGTNALWATDNGRDWLGNQRPPDELDRVTAGGDYGWPGCWGDRRPDPDLRRPGGCADTLPPALGFPAHVAALGIAFYTGSQFPAAYRGDAFVCFHGSWNRNPPIGYAIARVHFQNGRPTGWSPFVSGWLTAHGPWGRPVDPLVAPDGSLLVTDDFGGRIYRIRYRR